MLANACRYVGIQQTVAKYNLRMLYPTDFTLGTLIIIFCRLSPALGNFEFVVKGTFSRSQTYLDNQETKVATARPRKYRGVLKVKNREKTRQVHENWSQQLKPKH